MYNELDHQLKKLSGDKGNAPFWKRARTASKRHPVIRRALDDLLEFHELRNAIVHHRDYPSTLIASPAPEVLSALERIVTELTAPKQVIPTFASNIHIFAAPVPLLEVLRFIHGHGYSQVVARIDGELKLITTTAIAKWVAAQAAEGPVDFSTGALKDVLPYCREHDTELIASDAPVVEARQRFELALVQQRRLFALIITEHGAPTEDPLGIITPADLLED